MEDEKDGGERRRKLKDLFVSSSPSPLLDEIGVVAGDEEMTIMFQGEEIEIARVLNLRLEDENQQRIKKRVLQKIHVLSKMEIFYDHKLPSQHHQWFIAQNLVSHTQYFYTIHNKQYQYHYQCQVKELHGRRVRGCFHGWVVLSNHPDSVLWSIWNPLTSNFIRLPPLINHSYECCLSSPPDVQGSVLLLTTTKLPTIVFCRLDRKRKRLRWIEMSYAKQLGSISGVDDCFLQSPTCCNGKVYAMTLGAYYNFVIQVDIVVKGRQVVISLIPFVELSSTSYNRCPSFNSFQMMQGFLKGSCTDLFYIDVCYKDETVVGDVHLYKLDATSMMWEEMVELKNAIFFLQIASDHPTCYYSSTVDSEQEGYVHILGESGKILYSFDVKDRTISISSMPCIIPESQVSAWAMLEWRFELDLGESQQEEDATQIVVKPVKGDNIDYDNTIGESYILSIPIHILEVIMKHCVGIEYMRFRATCKHCRLAAPPIQWSNKTTLRRLQMYSLVSPWLMVLDNYRGIITFIDPLSGERYFIKTPQELKGDYQIYCSRFGWLLMYKIEHEPQLVFFNPFTSNIRKLPAVPYLENFCFSAPPTSSDCMVVGFTTSGQWHVYIHIVSGESRWHSFSLNFGIDDPFSYHFPTFNGRGVYALCNNEGVDAFRDVTDADFSWETVVDKAPISGFKSPAQYFLSSCDQHLLQIIVGKFGESVEVFKLNESTKEWEKIDGLGKHMIYISNTTCICLEAKSPEMGNNIYFPRLLHNDDTKIVFYSLETNRYHTFDDKSIQESFSADLLTTKHHSHPHTWIEPSWL
ncbi:hypothetical protein QVD17_07115 [Tagetes erecta]|uniref:KIB1-4 beta-propeller domain-containing protein n=1 Tax=Tagetes erecta TaxID=13708 RepID=A0AAD8LFJ3_TARER|nr:hypothetical protein QVD17_07115 [Tagetes erecta]